MKKRCLIIKTNYKTTENKFEIKDNITLMTILKKNGEELTAKFDTVDLEKVKNEGIWFAEWNKDFNNYLVQNISNAKLNKKSKPLKQSLQSIIMDASPNAPMQHINGDTLDNRRANLTMFSRNEKNEIEKVDSSTVSILLKDKYGNIEGKALISLNDLDLVVNDNYTWVKYNLYDEPCVVSHTPEGRVHLDRLILDPLETQKIHHINLNPLDCRQENLELQEI